MTITKDLFEQMRVKDNEQDNGSEKQNKPRYELLTTADFAEPQTPITWIVDGLISAGSINIVYGEPGCGKTWALLDLAICVAIGKDWLGMTTLAGPVLIIDEESGRRRISRRINEVMQGHTAGSDTPIFAVSLAAFDLGSPDDYVEIYNLITNTGACVVVVDALVDITPGRDENAVKDMVPIFLSLRKIADQTQAAIIVIHHSNKTGKYRGSSAIKGAIDLLLLVEKINDSNSMRFSTEKARDTVAGTFAGTMQFTPGAFLLAISETEKTTTATYNKGTRHILCYLAANTTGTQLEMQGAVDGCSKEAARKAIYFLVGIDLVKRVNPGGRGARAIYTLTEKGREAAERA